MIKINQTSKKDLNDCAKILIKEMNKQGLKFTKNTAKKHLEECFKNPGKYKLTLKLDNELIGYVFANEFNFELGKSLWIEELAIKKEYQKKGLGQKLISRLEQIAKKSNIKKIYLNTFIDFGEGFYLKNNYKKTKGILMTKKL